jgi:hypothetical protein
MQYPPEEIRKLIPRELDEETLAKMDSALRQWERIYVDGIGYPYRKNKKVPVTAGLLNLATHILKVAGQDPGAINLPYEYQDSEFPYGYEGIMEGLLSPHDTEGQKPFNYNFQGERPGIDVPYFIGDFRSPHDPVIELNPGSSGPNPNELECDFPPTGGDNY